VHRVAVQPDRLRKLRGDGAFAEAGDALEARVQKEVLVDRQVREEAIKLKKRGGVHVHYRLALANL